MEEHKGCSLGEIKPEMVVSLKMLDLRPQAQSKMPCKAGYKHPHSTVLLLTEHRERVWGSLRCFIVNSEESAFFREPCKLPPTMPLAE